jgi:hypothetical protein
MINCEHCGDPLVDGGIDWYCPKDDCHEKDIAKVYIAMRQRKAKEEFELYKRLKAKYES